MSIPEKLTAHRLKPAGLRRLRPAEGEAAESRRFETARPFRGRLSGEAKAPSRKIRNPRPYGYGYSLIELLTVIAILSLISPLAFTFMPAGRQSEEKTAIAEAENLADWLETAIVRSSLSKRPFSIIGSIALSPKFYLNWTAGPATKTEIHDAGTRALFTVPSGGTSVFNPVVSHLEGQLGMTIEVYRGSDRNRSKIIRYVIISRFGRVRVSEHPPND